MSSLTYEEKFIYFQCTGEDPSPDHNSRYLLYQPDSKRVIKTVSIPSYPDEFYFRRNYLKTDSAYKNGKFIIVGTAKKIEDRDLLFIVLKFDVNLDFKGQYYAHITKGAFPCNIINSDFGGCNVGWGSIWYRFKKEHLPRGMIVRSWGLYNAHPVSDSCYDKYDDRIVIALKDEDRVDDCYQIEVWRKEKDWCLERKSISSVIESQVIFVKSYNDFELDHLECSRQHIIVCLRCIYEGTYWHDSDYHIVLLDKYTFELKHWFEGAQPNFYDDYPTWFEQQLTLLKRLDLPFAVPLLKLILSFV